jgi:2-isopropylmalate synthase
MEEIYLNFITVADRKKDINDEDLRTLAGVEVRSDKVIKLDALQVVCGKSAIPVASVRLNMYGVMVTESAEGNGPIDAAFNAVKKIVKKKVRLEEFLIQAITRGSDDMGKVHVQVVFKGIVYYGFGASTDIITASVEAFIDAISSCLIVN